MSINVCVLGGNLTRDVEVKSVGNTKVATFTVACSRKYRLKDGTEKVEVNYLDCEAWDKLADTISTWFKKGSYITVQASAKTESWEDKNTGTKRSRTRFKVDNFFFPPKGGGKKSDDESEQNGQPDEGATGGGGGDDTPF
jgi:single-strand DNA-binding protein